jgi:hypothetical protein
MVTFPGSPLSSVTVTPAAGAGADSVTGKDTAWPGATVTFAGRLIVPGLLTVTVAVAPEILGEAAVAVIVAVPAATPCTKKLGLVVALAAIVTLAGTVAIAVLLDASVMGRPPVGAGAERIKLILWSPAAPTATA